MTIDAKIIADSISDSGKRITTIQLVLPRFILPELATHRVFSKSASSSRAVPIAKLIESARNNPAMPIHWGKNQPGMQADEEMDVLGQYRAKQMWMEARNEACKIAEGMMRLGVHKQTANRLLEPFLHISVILTGTEFSNFFELRCHKDAQPELQALAYAIRDAMDAKPTPLPYGAWHLPYITDEDRKAHEEETLKKISAARCCRVSYLRHDGTPAPIEEDLALCNRLVGSTPRHSSPFEHVATPDRLTRNSDSCATWDNQELHGNFVGWLQFRKILEATPK
jgi:hypothetical protein